jgi:hypothetical protein
MADIDDEPSAVIEDDPEPDCEQDGEEHDWQEQPGEPPCDVCIYCGKVRY